jgi:hypothetical protein
LHLSQQAKEREFLDHRKLQAAKVDDAGNPLHQFLFSDGFTIYTCNTPRFAKDSKEDRVIETRRIVGTEIICGPIKTVLMYRTDAMVGGGANSSIELLRQMLIDASILLRKRGLPCPRSLWLQFDNCGDNKNKEVNMYCSLLIELYAFDEIEIAFLIVGHTHASIDQYFSVIAEANHHQQQHYQLTSSNRGMAPSLRHPHTHHQQQHHQLTNHNAAAAMLLPSAILALTNPKRILSKLG